MLEDKFAIDNAEVKGPRERLFGRREMNWIGCNSATDIELPGAASDPAGWSIFAQFESRPTNRSIFRLIFTRSLWTWAE